eukprot:753249-Hanusia_phi.AAC.4
MQMSTKLERRWSSENEQEMEEEGQQRSIVATGADLVAPGDGDRNRSHGHEKLLVEDSMDEDEL